MPIPNEAMKEEAQRGLDWRDEFGRGGTEVGIARARDIVNGRNLSDDTIGRMVSYFARHEVDKEAEGFRPGEDGYPSNGRIAWALWGGDAGQSWANKEYDKIEDNRSHIPEELLESEKSERSEMENTITVTEVSDEVTEVIAEENTEVVEEVRKEPQRLTRSDAMEAVVEDDRRVNMAISSETPVERSYGSEVLDHSAESIDLSFLNSGRAPLLLDHDPEKQIGVIESVSLDGSARKLRATVRFGKSALASEVYGDVADNIRGNVSIGYSIAKMQKDKDGRTYRAVAWRPMEASIVSIPADVTVGVGRSLDEVISEAVVEEPQITETVIEETRESETKIEIKETKMENSVNVAVESRAFDAPVQQDVGMSKGEIKRFNLMRAINALANPTDRAAQRAAAFEFECSEAAQRAFGQSAQGILVPAEVLRNWNKRDLNTSDDAGLVGQQFRPDAFVDVLRNASSVMQAGATMLTGLQGNVKIPKKSAASSGGWFAESSAASESEMTITSITMAPKTVGAFTDVTRNLMMQGSPDVESLIRNDLAQALALAIDLGALAGTGQNGQPTGIRATSGINTKDFAATNPTFAEIVGMETEVAADNALLGNLAYIMNASMAGALKTTTKDSGSGQFVLQDGQINGYRAIVSNQVAAGDAYFGNFADLLIGMWGGLDILVDPYTASTTGTVRIVAMQSVDVAVRHAVSFCLGDADIA